MLMKIYYSNTNCQFEICKKKKEKNIELYIMYVHSNNIYFYINKKLQISLYTLTSHKFICV